MGLISPAFAYEGIVKDLNSLELAYRILGFYPYMSRVKHGREGFERSFKYLPPLLQPLHLLLLPPHLPPSLPPHLPLQGLPWLHLL